MSPPPQLVHASSCKTRHSNVCPAQWQHKTVILCFSQLTCAHRSAGTLTPRRVAAAAAALYGDREAERLEGAYRLAELSGVGGSDQGGEDAAVAVLAAGLEHEREAVRRSAQYGLAAAGPAACPALLAALRRPPAATAAAYALGEACRPAETEGSICEHWPATVVAELRAAIGRADAAAEARLLQLPAVEVSELKAGMMRGGRGYDGAVYSCLKPMDLVVTRQRRTIAAAACALGLIGSRAVVADDRETAAAATAELARLADRRDPAAICRSNLPPRAVPDNAAVGLLRLASAGRGQALSPAQAVSWDNPATRGMGALGGADRGHAAGVLAVARERLVGQGAERGGLPPAHLAMRQLWLKC